MGGLKKAVRKTAMKFGLTKRIYQGLEKKKHSALMNRYAGQPVNKKLVFFEAYKGRSYACSPKAIYLAMLKDKYFEDYRFVWVFDNPEKQQELSRMPRTTVTHKLSPEHIEAAVTAGIIVTNSRLVRAFTYRKEQFILQTWHGTPLKRLGLDIAIDGDAVESLEKIHQEYTRDGEELSALLSPSPYATEHLGSAFGLTDHPEKIWETGYPRNDFLYNFTGADAAAIRARLQLPEGKRVVLYAPTFRDKGFVEGKGYVNTFYLDLESLHRKFGDECVIIVRRHYFAAENELSAPDGFVINGNSVDDINELYVVSDVMITDYSSVMYDYAALRRPMLFYMPDLEEYKNNIRDFYMDPSLLPGPVVSTQEELEKQLGKALRGEMKADYSEFLDKFQPYEDGKRAQAVIEKLKYLDRE